MDLLDESHPNYYFSHVLGIKSFISFNDFASSNAQAQSLSLIETECSQFNEMSREFEDFKTIGNINDSKILCVVESPWSDEKQILLDKILNSLKISKYAVVVCAANNLTKFKEIIINSNQLKYLFCFGIESFGKQLEIVLNSAVQNFRVVNTEPLDSMLGNGQDVLEVKRRVWNQLRSLELSFE